MRAIFIHLSGSRRGDSVTFDQDRIRIGTASECDLRFDAAADRAVSPIHAEIRFENCDFILSDTSSAGSTFVNDRIVAEIILQDGDFIELGEGGPKLRFRVPPEDAAACKPFHLIVSDAQALARTHPTGGRIVSATDFLKHMALAVAREASPAAKVSTAAVALTLLAFLVLVPVGLLGIYRAQKRTEQAVQGIGARLREESFSREELARRNLIRPLATRGFIGDVQPHQITFDAQTAIGGGGGPLLDLRGRVVGVNFAVLRRFGGSNFAIPIRSALPLLE